MKVLLASQSPRRRELLKEVIPCFDVFSPEIDENYVADSPEKTVIEIAERKANAYRGDKNYDLIIASDTLVYFDGEYLGKPKDNDDAYNMLKKLNGNTHTVVTGIALKTAFGIKKDFAVSSVTFHKMTDGEIKRYINSYYLLDKAGAYAIQDDVIVQSYQGEYSNIMGLPIQKLKEMLVGISCSTKES